MVAQKWLWWSDNGKIFNTPVATIQEKFTWIVAIKNFAIIRPPQPLLDHHLWFHNFFYATFFALAAPFLQFGCFYGIFFFVI